MADEINRKSKEVWEKFLKIQPEANLMFPDENLIKIFSNRYVEVPKPPAKLLDHGFGSGNNLVFFATKGYDCYGLEIAKDLIRVANEKFEKLNLKVDLKEIIEDSFDYEENFFNIIVSWNAIHYLGTREKVMKVIDEFFRILKPNGVLILSTLHPDNALFNRFEAIGDNSYKIVEDSPYDNRKGLIMYATKNKKELTDLFLKFSTVKLGFYSNDLFLPERINSARLIYAIK